MLHVRLRGAGIVIIMDRDVNGANGRELGIIVTMPEAAGSTGAAR